ncbi:MAG: hypothetical protein F4Y47_10950 [Acidobacteriia bacterium]|nr:hypothetical protein [Terriglobia bacterium]MYG01696.1 hypothetical protein [Terriglobia bacterium]MYK12181.1 hypothetical protein [Terriglobia bacterium]
MTLLKLAALCLFSTSLAVWGQTQADQTQNSGSSPSGGDYGGYGAGAGIPSGGYGSPGGGNVPYGGGTSRGPSPGGQDRSSPSNPGSRQPPTRDRSSDSLHRDTYDNSHQSNTNDRMRQLGTPVYLHGRVVTDAGEPPPERVIVKLNCGARSTPQDYTDRKGRFSFQPGGNQSLTFSYASVSRTRAAGRSSGLTVGSSGSANLSQCHLEAELTGYRSDRLSLGIFRMGSNDVGLIVLHRLDGLIGDTVSVTTLAAPTSAQKAYRRGLKALHKARPNREEAIRHLERAVEVYPEYATAWAALGEARRGLEDGDGARTAYTRAMEADPKFLLPYEPLMDLALNRMDWTELDSLTERYLRLAPRSAKARFLRALAAANQNDLARAESLIRSLKEVDEKDRWPLSYVIMAAIHERRAEWERAASEYRAYIALAADQRTVEMAKRRLHEWETLRIIGPIETIEVETP